MDTDQETDSMDLAQTVRLIRRLGLGLLCNFSMYVTQIIGTSYAIDRRHLRGVMITCMQCKSCIHN